MIKTILSAATLSLTLASAAWALPALQTPPSMSSGVIQIKDYDKGHYGGKHYDKRDYHGNHGDRNWKGHRYGNRYWGHRYSYRPNGWQTLGCVAAGPVWYCP